MTNERRNSTEMAAFAKPLPIHSFSPLRESERPLGSKGSGPLTHSTQTASLNVIGIHLKH
uniref:Uncharacterized protein n=1 Tax=Anguilla anguilla TaxID=7936 RepID=A0A0E9X1Y1_ANGAN